MKENKLYKLKFENIMLLFMLIITSFQILEHYKNITNIIYFIIDILLLLMLDIMLYYSMKEIREEKKTNAKHRKM